MLMHWLRAFKKRASRLLERSQNLLTGQGWNTDAELKKCLREAAEAAKRAGKYRELVERFDGAKYVVGTNDLPWNCIDAPVQGVPGERNPLLYEAVINQFGVSTNPRYRRNQQGKDETYCNIFVWDVSRAMGAEIPHWVDGDGNPRNVGEGVELDANRAIEWLETYGSARAWRTLSAEEAQDAANQGYPVVVTWKNLEGIGHIAVVRPGEHSIEEGPTIAQAGASNFNVGTAEQGFRCNSAQRTLVYYCHD